ncbi:hypothetical protein DVA86_14050 [Streptomyces armeniacus]|uniref:Uncharacterized protein n=1 Tax=Streptomyces armeniacus TaxID=83291 RepID=A0A345XPP2_9ACTN|nr:hypothetical protein [Streptomyces armeniacus]AXK33608.1 hypothetical protein DVA86_14050 [Streptomyces armeniacus]
MAATPPPPSGAALERPRYRLRLLHRQSGEPSFRVVAQRTGKAISHTTAGRSHREGETHKELLLTLEARADLADRLTHLHEQLGRERGRNEELSQRVADLEAERREHSRRIERLQDELREVRDERLALLEQLSGLHARRAELYFTWARDEEAGGTARRPAVASGNTRCVSSVNGSAPRRSC